ncbi:acyl-CoA dehydrogenase family protein [Paenibacillus sp. RC84]|uniref:acyl-CoA dehydrogenase family protein n=1 Tax=Paenibacillus sp. RC84 TaxID=3156252 RepID=UPI0035149512
MNPSPFSFARTAEERERLEGIGRLADTLRDEAARADEENGFSYGAIDALKEARYPSLTVPAEYGGAGASLYEFVLLQERLAQGDAATALGIGWHLGIVLELANQPAWQDKYEALCRDIASRNLLINRAATEKGTGSPSRGGRPATTAADVKGGYLLNGRKTFTTLAPALDLVIVTASLEPDGSHGEFVFPVATEGVRIEPTWDMVGMRGTASHDLVLEDVLVPPEARVKHTRSEPSRPGPAAHPYLLHIPACYLGIALAARREAVSFAAAYRPNSLPHPILELPHIRQLIGEIELELSAARHFLYAVAQRWESAPANPGAFAADLSAVKTFAVRTALAVVDKSMRIAGAHSLAMTHPLQRLYRDVRFGLHNPPMDDVTLKQLADRAERELLQPPEGTAET